MYNTSLRIVKDSHWAEDAMQEAFLKAFKKMESFKGEVAFGAWLKKIVVNQSLDTYKKISKNANEALEEVLYKVEDDVGDDEAKIDFEQMQVQQVTAAIQALNDNYRLILNLHYIEGYDNEEICAILNISPGNCRTTMSRAKSSLLQKLKI